MLAALQVGTSLCNFLHIDATFSPQPVSRSHAAQVLLQFGSPSQLRSAGAGRCSPARDAEAAAAADAAVEWPVLGGIEVLGWHLPVEAMTVEVVQRTDTCGGLEVVRSLAPPHGAVGAGLAGLRLDLSALGHRLQCPFGLRLSWRSADSIDSA